MRNRNSKHGQILKKAAIWGGAALLLIGIIVTEGVETIKTGYIIDNLNKIWQEENFQNMTLAKKINFYTDIEKTEDYISNSFKLKRARMQQIVFIKQGKDGKR